MDENADNGRYTPEIQGNILRGFTYPYVRFLFVALARAHARGWAKYVVERYVTHGGVWSTKPDQALTVAFTHPGLMALGVKPEILTQFPTAFRAGMRSRRKQIGDAEHEVGWDPVFTKGAIHALVSLYGNDETALDAKVDELCLLEGVEKLAVQGATRQDDREHFGFRDGISQPVTQDPDDDERWKSDVPIREFLIFPSCWNDGNSSDPVGLELGRLGTYLVYRKLQQHVDRFQEFLRGWSVHPDLVAAKMVGRWPDGTPVTEHYVPPDQRRNPDANDFDFSDDLEGKKCPFGAHISRANPRDRLPVTADQHRILRRGVIYGPPVGSGTQNDGLDGRGLVFIALNASIENQFEFVQRAWVNQPSFNGLDGVDPIAHSREGRLGNFRLKPGGAFRPLLQDFVQLRGGEYFFVPSMRALTGLVRGDFGA